ncbi:MAG TPA: hypothetical protein VFT34_13575 [Verrucomicrobiae bacterium]|nr:hypothetical protein [Verrucomicrobiae bacterium]
MRLQPKTHCFGRADSLLPKADAMSFQNKLRMQGDLPYNPAVPDPLPDAPPAPPTAAYAAPVQSTEILSESESDIAASLDAQQREDAREESIPQAVLGGLAAAALCIVLAGGFAALTHFWHKAMSVGIGFAVAWVVKRFGRGNDIRFGLIGAFCALVACVGAYHLAWAFVLAASVDMSILDYISSIDDWGEWMTEILGPYDLFFYAVATYCGYKYSYDAVADKY